MGTKIDKNKDLLTIREASDLTGISYAALWQRIQSGSLRAHLWNGKKRVYASDVRAMLKGIHSPKKSQNESDVEKAFVKELNNGIAIKMKETGFPDRLVLLEGGRALFLEFKSNNNKLQPNQNFIKEMLETLGFPVFKVTSVAQAHAVCLKRGRENEELYQ